MRITSLNNILNSALQPDPETKEASELLKGHDPSLTLQPMEAEQPESQTLDEKERQNLQIVAEVLHERQRERERRRAPLNPRNKRHKVIRAYEAVCSPETAQKLSSFKKTA